MLHIKETHYENNKSLNHNKKERMTYLNTISPPAAPYDNKQKSECYLQYAVHFCSSK